VCGGGYTWRQILTKSVILSQKIQLIEFLAIFSAVVSLVQGWLPMRFSPRAGDAKIFKNIASPSQAKNRSCKAAALTENLNTQARYPKENRDLAFYSLSQFQFFGQNINGKNASQLMAS